MKSKFKNALSPPPLPIGWWIAQFILSIAMRLLLLIKMTNCNWHRLGMADGRIGRTDIMRRQTHGVGLLLGFRRGLRRHLPFHTPRGCRRRTGRRVAGAGVVHRHFWLLVKGSPRGGRRNVIVLQVPHGYIDNWLLITLVFCFLKIIIIKYSLMYITLNPLD